MQKSFDSKPIFFVALAIQLFGIYMYKSYLEEKCNPLPFEEMVNMYESNLNSTIYVSVTSYK